MNPYNAETDYKLAVAWEEGYLAALETVLEQTEVAAQHLSLTLVPLETRFNDLPAAAAANALAAAVKAATRAAE